MKKWTVGFVNFRSSVYVEYQLKILYEFNNVDDFDLVIVDNSNDEQEFENLSKLCRPYIEQYGNITLLNNLSDISKLKEVYGDRFFVSGHHGEGIKIIYDIAKKNSQYLLVQDPDFFYVKKNYLQIFEKLHQEGNIAVGAPYPKGAAWGDPFYPEAYGCSYIVSYLNDSSFTPGFATEEEMKIFNEKYEGKYKWWGFDVGWRIRKDYSDKPFVSFDQRKCSELIKKIGQQFRSKPREYSFKGDIIGYHLNGGTRHPKEKKEYVEQYNSEQLEEIFNEWQDIRKKYSVYFYGIILHDKEGGFFNRFIKRLKFIAE